MCDWTFLPRKVQSSSISSRHLAIPARPRPSSTNVSSFDAETPICVWARMLSITCSHSGPTTTKGRNRVSCAKSYSTPAPTRPACPARRGRRQRRRSRRPCAGCGRKGGAFTLLFHPAVGLKVGLEGRTGIADGVRAGLSRATQNCFHRAGVAAGCNNKTGLPSSRPRAGFLHRAWYRPPRVLRRRL